MYRFPILLAAPALLAQASVNLPTHGPRVLSPSYGAVAVLGTETLQLLGPTGKVVRSAQAPSGAAWVTADADRFWAFLRPSATGDVRRQEIQVHQGKAGWSHWGTLELEKNAIGVAVPLEDDRFFATFANPLTVGDREGIIGILKRDDAGKVVVDQVVDVPDLGPFYPAPAALSAAEGAEPARYPSQRWRWFARSFIDFETGIPGVLVEHPDGFAIVNRHMGLFWFFNRKGVYQGALDLLGLQPELGPKPLRFQDVARVVLGLQAMPDGTLLVATRRKDGVLLGKLQYPLLDKDGKAQTDAGQVAASKKWEQTDFPYITYWEITPKSRTAKEVPAPAGAPELLTDEVLASGVSWTYGPNLLPVFKTKR